MTKLSDDELAAYAEWAANESDGPLASMVAELRQHRRRAGDRLAIVVLPDGQAALLPYLLAATSSEVLVVAPTGTTLTRLQAPGGCIIESYDPAVPGELRQRLRAHGIGL